MFVFVGSFAKKTYLPGSDIDIMVTLSDKCEISPQNESGGAPTEFNGVELVYGGAKMNAQKILDKFLAATKTIFINGKLKNKYWIFDMKTQPRKTPPTISATVTVKIIKTEKDHEFSLDLTPVLAVKNSIFIPFQDTKNFLQTSSNFEHYFYNSNIPRNARPQFVIVVRILKV